MIIHKNEELKKHIFNLLSIYLEGRLFTIETLISNDPLAVQKYKAWLTQKNRHQSSFDSSASLHSNSKESALRRKRKIDK